MSKIDFKKIDFKNITPEQKKQFLVGGGLVIVVGAFIYFATPKSDDKKADDFNIPENTDVKNYNSKTDALNNKRTQQTGQDLGEIYRNDSVKTETLNFSDLDKQMAQAQFNSTNQKEEPKTTSNNPPQQSISNSHNVYGDYSMWQSDEPKNNSVGYTNKKGVPAKKVKQTESYEEITPQSNYTQPSYNQPTYNNSSNVDLAQQQQISAQLISQGTFQDGRTLSFALKEETTIKGNKLPKNFIIQGIGQFQNNRIMVRFNAIKVNNKLVPVNIILLDGNGIEGMGVAGSEKTNDVEGRAANEVISRTGTVGQIVNSIVKSKPNERTVSLKPKQVYLVIN